MTTVTDPLSSFIATIEAISDKLDTLQELVADQLGHDPDSIHWDHVGDAKRVDAALGEILHALGVPQ